MKKLFFLLITTFYSFTLFADETTKKVDINSHDMIWRIPTFIVFLAILHLLLRKPLMKILDNKGKEVSDLIKKLETEKDNAKKELANYEVEFNNLKTELSEMKSQAIKFAESEKTKVVKSIDLAIENMKKSAEEYIISETNAAKLKLLKEFTDKIIKTTEDKLLKEFDDKKQINLINDNLNGLGK